MCGGWRVLGGENDRVSRLWFVALVSLAVSMSAEVSAAQQWANRYFDPGDGERIPSCVRVLQDGGYIVVGQAIDTKTKVSSGWLMRLDTSGSKLWARTYSNQAQGKPSSAFTWAEQTSDGGFIACGWVHASNTEGSEGQGWMVKLSGSGEKQWSSEIGGKGAGQLRRVRVADDGGYIGVGSYSATVTAVGSDGWAVRIGRSGKLIWSATYGDAADDELWDVRPTSDGGYVAVGSLTEAFGGSRVGWALGLARSGKIRWQKAYKGLDKQEFRAMSALSDDGFVAAGQVDGGRGWLAKISPTGDLDWQRAYTPNDAEELSFSAVDQTQDGEILVAGEKPGVPPISLDEGLAVSMTSEGTPKWAKVMGWPWLESLTALDLSGEGVVWAGSVSGYHRNQEVKDCLVLRTAQSGEACDGLDLEPNAGLSSTARLVGNSTVKKVPSSAGLRPLNPRALDDGLEQGSYCTMPFLEQTLVLSRSPQSDGVTVKYECTNAGRDTVPFRIRVFFSRAKSNPPDAASDLVLDVDLKDGLKSGETIGPLYSINAKKEHEYAVAIIYPEGEVSDIPIGQTVVSVPLP